MYRPTARVMAVLELLQSHGRLTGAELARRLEVDIRTLRRYVTILQDMGIPILAERGRYGAYELGPGFKLPPLMFTNEEGLALSVGLLAARYLSLAPATHVAESARAKLERVMPLELRARVRALAETIAFDLSAAPISASSEVMLTLGSAAQAQRRVRLRYRSGQDAETERDFDPYGLAFHQHKWYVVGYCHLRRDLRSFRLDRVAQVKNIEARFKRPEAFDPLTYMARANASLPRPFPFEVLLKADLAPGQYAFIDELGLLEPRAGGTLLRGRTDDLDWLARQLARFPCDFVVQQPEALRAALRRRAAELRKLAAARA